jgi:splicing factor 3B subunit 3
LRKCQSHNFPTRIRTITPMGDRIFVGDMEESFRCLQYNFDTNMFGTLAFDKIPRFITCACALDYNTIAGGDRFGSIFVLAVPDNVDLIDFSLRQPENYWDQGTTRESFQRNNRLDAKACFYVGQIVTSIVKKPLVMGGSDVLVYSTLLGGIGSLMPFVSPSKAEFFETLQKHLRKEVEFLSGWRHVAYRSYFAPVQHVIDGDLCELFAILPYSKQKEIASELDATPKEVIKWVEEMRTKCYV